jgi:hypothetical protein
MRDRSARWTFLVRPNDIDMNPLMIIRTFGEFIYLPLIDFYPRQNLGKDRSGVTEARVSLPAYSSASASRIMSWHFRDPDRAKY